MAQPNENLQPAGMLADGALTLSLELRQARWFPDADSGNSLVVPVFAEAGKAPQVPGPLLRVPAGTEIRLKLHNQLRRKATLYGLHTRPGAQPSAVELAPDEQRELHFRAGAPGTYHYYAITDPEVTKLAERWYHDGALSGAFIVDDPAAPAPDDRVLVINVLSLRATPIMAEHELLTINGKAWPYTERLKARQGETVRWRVVNSTPSEHPMHLHGAYFTVTGVGNAEAFTAYKPEERRTVVTEFMLPGTTYDMEWVPLAPGGWLFHCHYVLHMVPELALPSVVKAHAHEAAPSSPVAHHTPAHGMGGLVMRIDVAEGAERTPAVPRGPARQLELVLERNGDTVVSTVRDVARNTSASGSPGPALVLRRDEPVDIRVINRLNEETAIHWHGLELDSYHDGVPYVGGTSRQVTPPIPPGGTFVAQMTPPRSGTFIYHTHWGHEAQLVNGLYGPLLVLDPQQKYDPERDRSLVVATAEVRWGTPHVRLNGAVTPPPMDFRRGQTYRLRFINIAPNQDVTVTLGEGDELLEWRSVAKDGFELPASQRRVAQSRLVFSVGETYDFEFTPRKSGTYKLRARSHFAREGTGVAEAEVRVRDR